MLKLILAIGITLGLFGGIVYPFLDSPTTITEAMIIAPRGSVASSLTHGG